MRRLDLESIRVAYLVTAILVLISAGLTQVGVAVRGPAELLLAVGLPAWNLRFVVPKGSGMLGLRVVTGFAVLALGGVVTDVLGWAPKSGGAVATVAIGGLLPLAVAQIFHYRPGPQIAPAAETDLTPAAPVPTEDAGTG